MDVPLELSFQHITNTKPLRDLVERKVQSLDRKHRQLVACRVAISSPEKPGPQRGSKPQFRVRVDVTVPNHEFVAIKDQNDVPDSREIRRAVIAAFEAIDKQLRAHGEQTHPAERSTREPPVARVIRLEPEQHYGWIRAADGREIYFHANAVSHNRFEELEVGQEVHFQETLTEAGPKASHVKPYKTEGTIDIDTEDVGTTDSVGTGEEEAA